MKKYELIQLIKQHKPNKKEVQNKSNFKITNLNLLRLFYICSI